MGGCERKERGCNYVKKEKIIAENSQENIIYALLKNALYGKIKWERVGEFSYRAKISDDGIMAEISQYTIDYFTLFFFDSNLANDILWSGFFEAVPWNQDFEIRDKMVEGFIAVRDIYKLARNSCNEDKIIKNLVELREK